MLLSPRSGGGMAGGSEEGKDERTVEEIPFV
jgi:hypothetical protein